MPDIQGAQGENASSPCCKINDRGHSRVIAFWGGVFPRPGKQPGPPGQGLEKQRGCPIF